MNIPNYSSIVATLSGMTVPEALAWLAKPEHGYTPEQQFQLMRGREMSRRQGCSY